jgi:hypothetical protein
MLLTQAWTIKKVESTFHAVIFDAWNHCSIDLGQESRPKAIVVLVNV